MREAIATLPAEQRTNVKILFAAHSIPLSMAQYSRYEAQLREAAKLICAKLGHENWELVFQSRSGPPQQPWLEPDVCDRIEELHTNEALKSCVVCAARLYLRSYGGSLRLDEEAATLCKEKGIMFARAKTVGVHPEFVG